MTRESFNKAPYFDDFDEDKNFYKILFKPRGSIQTRELNQLQEILSNQTEQFSDHIFKYGSMVKVGQVKYTIAKYVRLKDLDVLGNDVTLDLFDGRRIRGENSGLEAIVIHLEGKTDTDPYTIYVKYTNTAIDGETIAFIDGEIINVLDDAGFVTYQATVRCPSCPEDADIDTIEPTGLGTLFSIDEASYYVHGRAIPLNSQIINLNKYDTTPSFNIGLDVVETLVESSDDPSLFDNAIGSPNYTAPGADRYKIELVLTKTLLTSTTDENFVKVAVVDGGVLQDIVDRPQYSEIMNTLARRTYDESGDYTVIPFIISFKEHLTPDGSNVGLFEEADGGDESKYGAIFSPGTAYIKGFEVNKQAESFVVGDKARDTEAKRSTAIRPGFGNYMYVTLDPASNIIPLTDTTNFTHSSDFEAIDLYDQAISGMNFSGNLVGTVRTKGMELYSGVVGVDAVWKLYLFDMQFEPGKTIEDIQGLFATGGGSQTFGANPELDGDSHATLNDPNNNSLLFTLPYPFIKSIRDADDPNQSNTLITISKKYINTVPATGNIEIFANSNETFPAYDQFKWIGGLQDGNNYIPIDLTAIDVVTSTPTKITLQIGSGNVGKKVVLVAEVLQSSSFEKEKIIRTQSLQNIAADQETIDLDVADAYEIVSVTLIPIADPLTPIDVTSDYSLNKNIKDLYYDISTLTFVGDTLPVINDLLTIEVKYFDHVGDGEYFSADSYSTIINDPNEDFSYIDIPTHTTADGITYELRDSLDFRPRVGDDGTFTGTNSNISDLPADNSNIIFDMEYYLPRIDIVSILSTGEFIITKGTPALEPVIPATPQDAMRIYELYINPYTVDAKKDIRYVYVDNRRYTMRDIGAIVKRVSNLEYYVSFNLLEKNTSDLSVLDENGNERFKNGFLADNFKDFIASDLANEYYASLDTAKGELRPQFFSRSIGIEFDEAGSTNVKSRGKIVTMNYSEVELMTQPFASKTLSINPYFVFAQGGSMLLNPSSDVWRDVITEPDINVRINTGWDDLAAISGGRNLFGTLWNEWNTTGSSSTSRPETSTRPDFDSTNGATIEINTGGTIVNTTTSQARTGTNIAVQTNIESFDLGASVTDVNLIAKMRAQNIGIAVSGLTPNTKLYTYFDGVDVTEFTRPMGGVFGQDLVTDSVGNVLAVFRVPNNNQLSFFVGTRILRVTNVADNSTDIDELTTFAETNFFSSGLEVTERNTVISAVVPNFVTSTVTDTRSATTQSVIPNPDPVAQSFSTPEDSDIFVTKCDIFFSAVDPNFPVWFEIREMINGYPGPLVVPLTRVDKPSSDINISDDASIATTFEFEGPALLLANTDYCFVVGGDTKLTRLHVARLGETTVGANPVLIDTQPHMGSLFKSQNNKTWNAEQYEDVKFTLYKAKFDTTPMQLKLSNSDIYARDALDNDPFETEVDSNLVRVYHKDHGFIPNDKVKLEILSDTYFSIVLTSGTIAVGQKIVGATNGGTAILTEVISDGLVGADDTYRIKIRELTGFFADDESISAVVVYEEFGNPTALATLGIPTPVFTFSPPQATITAGIDNTFNGIPLSELSTNELNVEYVDSMDSYVVQVTTLATERGRAGGQGVNASPNIQVDTLQLQAKVIDFAGDNSWVYDGVTHSGIGGTGTNYIGTGEQVMIINQNSDLLSPIKIANKTNADARIGAGLKSLNITGTFTTPNENISPVFNLDTLHLISVTNRIDWNTCNNYSVDPLDTIDGTPLICDPDDGSYSENHRWMLETNASGGSEKTKYVTKQVNLQTSASNIVIYVDMLNFLHTDIEVYYRTLAAESNDKLRDQPWVLAPEQGTSVSSTDVEFIENELNIPSIPGQTLPLFKSFQVKIILKSKNSARPPKIKNFRAIAVT